MEGRTKVRRKDEMDGRDDGWNVCRWSGVAFTSDAGSERVLNLLKSYDT
jgi:hypothetical protein